MTIWLTNLPVNGNLYLIIPNMKQISLSELALNELFDFHKIQEYEYRSRCNGGRVTGEFVIESKYTVTLESNEFPFSVGGYTKELPEEFDVKSNKLYDLSYLVEGDPSQYMKTDSGILLRVLKTVFTWIKEDAIPCIENTSSSKRPIFHIASHAKDLYGGGGDKTKDRIYNYLVNKYLPSNYNKYNLHSSRFNKDVIVFQKK
jgi:hypothetical protein